jgi:hypothetical protein
MVDLIYSNYIGLIGIAIIIFLFMCYTIIQLWFKKNVKK